MVLMNSNGTQTVFESSGSGKFKSPAGDAAYTLSETSVGGKTQFLLSDNGAVTTFALPAGSSGNVWTPAVSEGAGGVDVTSFAYRLENPCGRAHGGARPGTGRGVLLADAEQGLSCVEL